MHLFPQLLNRVIDIIPNTLHHINFILVVFDDFILICGFDGVVDPAARIPIELPKLILLFVHIYAYINWINNNISILPTILHEIKEL